MNRTKIEWTDWTWNPVTGCNTGCPYCYARSLTERFKEVWGYDFTPQLHPERLEEPMKVKKPSKIFTCSMGELFGPWVPEEWVEKILDVMTMCPQHIFQILTKWPYKTHLYHFPPNVWLGVSVENQESTYRIPILLKSNAKVKFASLEPMLGPINPKSLSGLDWIIIGGLTGRKPRKPSREWIQQIIFNTVAPIFVKDNAWPNKWGPYEKRVIGRDYPDIFPWLKTPEVTE